MRVLVAGATGCVGGGLLPALVAEGHEVHALARRPPAGERAGLRWFRGDVLSAPSLVAPLAGVEAAVYLVHALERPDSYARDPRAADTFARAAARAGVQHILYLGGLRPTGAGSPHLDARAATAAALRQHGVPVTELRAGVIVARRSYVFEVMRALVDRHPVVLLSRGAATRAQPVALRDVVSSLAALLGRPERAGHSYDLGGPEVLSWTEMFRRYARVAGLRRRFVHVPWDTPRLSAAWMALWSGIPARACLRLVEGIGVEALVQDPLPPGLPSPACPYEEAVRLALDSG